MSRLKKILLVNNVIWNETYPAQHPLKNVTAWYKKMLSPLKKFHLHTLSPEDPELARHFECADAIILTGSPRNAWNNDYPTLRLLHLLEHYTEKGKAILGICYGHQLLARACGGLVHYNPQGWEIGFLPVTLTPQGKASPLFQSMPETFLAIESHHDIVADLPPEAVWLAKSEKTRHQAFQIGKAAFGVQFHPEMNRTILNFIWKARLDHWQTKIPFNIRDRIKKIPKTLPHPQMISNFIHHFT
ncbi:MAG: type 1 glutamine amidotransferase [Verrucomicrobiia bacterium]